MLDAVVTGFGHLLSLQMIGLMLLGVVLGSFFGATPGLGGHIGVALMIPFVFGMDPYLGLGLLLSLHAVVHTAGSIPGILFAIPGTTPTVATIVDGYPMTQQGRAGVAMGAQLTASAVGGVVGAVVLAALIPILQPIALAMGSGEMFMLIVLGLTFIIVISRESIPKGMLTALLGLGLATVGLEEHSGVGRFVFGQLWLWDGIHIVTVVLGIFGLAELTHLGARGGGGQIAEAPADGTELDFGLDRGQLWEGTRDVYRNWWLTLRTAVIGTVIGIIPGLGGETSTWICYGHAAQTEKNTENFGKGDVRGVIAVETSNNAKEGGGLLPTLVFGIPGSSGLAILMGGMMILGVAPGPQMLTEGLDMIWFLVFVLVISNIVAAAMLFPISGYMAKLAYVRGSMLIPAILVVIAVGSFAIGGLWQAIILTFVFGLLGYGMKKWDYPRAPLVLGFILGPMAENTLKKALGTMGAGFLTRPAVLVLLALAIISFVVSIRREFGGGKKMQGGSE